MSAGEFRSVIRGDARGIFVWVNGEKHRPGGVPGYDHAYDMGDAGLKIGDYVWARHVSQSALARVTTREGKTVVWGSEYLHDSTRRPFTTYTVSSTTLFQQSAAAEREMARMLRVMDAFAEARPEVVVERLRDTITVKMPGGYETLIEFLRATEEAARESKS